MIDPVRMSPTYPVASNATKGAAVAVDPKATPVMPRPSTTTASTSVPRLLDLAAELSRGGPPVDDAKIAQVRRAIADGSYKIDADALAKAIIGYARKA